MQPIVVAEAPAVVVVAEAPAVVVVPPTVVVEEVAPQPREGREARPDGRAGGLADPGLVRLTSQGERVRRALSLGDCLV